MKRWKEKLEIWAMAVTYAERGDRETAMRFLGELRESKESRQEARETLRKQAVNRTRNYKM